MTTRQEIKLVLFAALIALALLFVIAKTIHFYLLGGKQREQRKLDERSSDIDQMLKKMRDQ